MARQVTLPGYQARLETFRKRLTRLKEETMLRETDFEYIIPELSADRLKYWRFAGSPTADSLSLIAQAFRVPLDYLWPPMPEDGARLDRDRIRQDLRELQAKADRGELTPEEQERYATLLDIEKRLSGVGYITFRLRPVAKLVCVLERLPLRAEDLPPWTGVWHNAMVLPLEGVDPADPVYAYKLPARVGEFEAGTTVVFRPLYADPSQRDLVIGVLRQLPHIAEWRVWPEGAVPLGRVILSMTPH